MGNFTQRVLKLLDNKYNKKVPDLEQLEEADEMFLKKIYSQFFEFVQLLEDVKIKDALKIAVSISHTANIYIQ